MSITFSHLLIDPLPDDGVTDSAAAMVFATAETPFGANAFVRAWIGEQPVTRVTIDQYGAGFSGFLDELPDDTDTLRVSINGDEAFDTGLTTSDLPPIA